MGKRKNKFTSSHSYQKKYQVREKIFRAEQRRVDFLIREIIKATFIPNNQPKREEKELEETEFYPPACSKKEWRNILRGFFWAIWRWLTNLERKNI